MEFKFEYIFLVIFALVVGLFVLRILKYGGFKAAMFGAEIKNTIGEVTGDGPKFISFSIKIHELDGSPEKTIGLELVAKSIASYHMTPITLSMSEAKKLTGILNRVIN